MDYFLEITVLPDPEFKETTLMNALYAKLHRALGQQSINDIGVSFPKHDKTLGPTIRLHGKESSLGVLMEAQWLQGLRDYCRIGELAEVPDNVQYRIVRRVQAKSAYNKRKRSVAKGWLTPDEAQEQIPDTQQKTLKLPYAQVRSLSTGNMMRVYVEHGPPLESSIEGSFSSYGLSPTSTIPWF